MNNLQQIASDISGYCGFEPMGARDGGYYNCDLLEDRVSYINLHSHLGDNVKPLTARETLEVFYFLDQEWANQNEKYYAWKLLGA
jgi:hypothetical protein